MKSTGSSISTRSVMSTFSKMKFSSRIWLMLSSEPVSRLSRQITRWPRPSRASLRWEPRKPAPPVTTQVLIAARGYLRMQSRRRQARHLGRRSSRFYRWTLTFALVERFENGVVTVKLGRAASAGTTVVERTL